MPDTLATLVTVTRALVDAAFKSSGISDADHAALQAQLDTIDPATAEAAQAAAEAQATADAEAASQAAYEAWKAQQPAPAPADGTETGGFGG